VGCAKSPQLAESVPLATPLARFGKSARTASKQTVKKAGEEGACLVSRGSGFCASRFQALCQRDCGASIRRRSALLIELCCYSP
jgi:hypothetical protein